MALGDLASIRIHTATYPLFNECALSFQCLSPSDSWRELLLDEWCTEILPVWMSGLVETCEVRNVTLVDIVPGTAADITGDTHGIEIGSIAADPVPPTVAGLVSWLSGGVGRSTRGRNYIAGMPRTRLRADGYRWTTAGEDYLQAVVDAMMDAYGPIGFSPFGRLVVISRQIDFVPQVPPVSFPVLEGRYSSVIARQNRRLER